MYSRAKEHHQHAKELLARGQYIDAIHMFNEAISHYSTDNDKDSAHQDFLSAVNTYSDFIQHSKVDDNYKAKSYDDLAAMCFSFKEFELAIFYFQIALQYCEKLNKSSADKAEIYLNCAIIRLELNNIEGAIKDLNMAVDVSAKAIVRANAFFYRARAYYWLGDNEHLKMALAECAKALTIDGQLSQDNSIYSAIIRLRGNINCALKDYRKGIADLSSAVGDLRNLSAEDKRMRLNNANIAMSLNERASAYEAIGEYKLACDDCELALTSDAISSVESIEIIANLCKIYETSGHHDMSIKIYTEALTIEKDPMLCAKLYHGRADCYFEMQKKYSEKTTKNSFNTSLVNSYRDSAFKDYESAKSYYHNDDPNMLKVMINLGVLCMAKGEFNSSINRMGAIDYFTAVIDANPSNQSDLVSAYYNRSKAYKTLDAKDERAYADLEKVVTLQMGLPSSFKPIGISPNGSPVKDNDEKTSEPDYRQTKPVSTKRVLNFLGTSSAQQEPKDSTHTTQQIFQAGGKSSPTGIRVGGSH